MTYLRAIGQTVVSPLRVGQIKATIRLGQIPRTVNLSLVVDDCFVLHALEKLGRYT
jgi:hypothetical protein